MGEDQGDQGDEVPSGRPAEPQFAVHEVSPSYWRVTFENGPVNLIDVESVEQLADVISRIEESPAVSVVVFDSANPDCFMAHWDLRFFDRGRLAAMSDGPTGQPAYVDNLVRLSKVPAVTISAIRGRVRGAGSEFVLATDIRFAGDKAILGHFEVGAGRARWRRDGTTRPARGTRPGSGDPPGRRRRCRPSSRSATGM